MSEQEKSDEYVRRQWIKLADRAIEELRERGCKPMKPKEAEAFRCGFAHGFMCATNRAAAMIEADPILAQNFSKTSNYKH